MKILVPVDGSAYGLRAIDFIASRTHLVGDDPKVEVVNVQAVLPTGASKVAGKEAIRAYYGDEAERALRPALKRLAKAGIATTSKVLLGNAAEEIAEIAAKDKVDLIVMGSHGHGAFKGLLVGSVTHSVMARCLTPVLLLRSGKAPTADALKIGIALDGSKYSLAAVKYLIKHRELLGTGSNILLINVVSDFVSAMMPDMSGLAMPVITDEDIASMQKAAFDAAMAPARKQLAKARIAAEEIALVGIPGDQLASFAKKRKLDVLVMGSHGYGSFRAAVMGSVATRVAAKSELPLLLIRSA